MIARSPRSPLASYAGTRPPRPDWYEELAIEPERVIHPVVEGARLEVLVWGDRGKPGILLAHGIRAHARWWGPVAPLLANGHRLASLSWSGMGGSDWRPAYSTRQQMTELFAAAEAAGLFDAAVRPVFIGHSFGTRALVMAAAEFGERLAGAIVVDGTIAMPPARSPFPMGSDKRYATLAEALGRFDLVPSQPCDHPFILDDIARAGIEHVEDGWRWRCDPEYYAKFVASDVWPYLAEVRCNLAFVYGEESSVLTPARLAELRQQAPAGTSFVGIPSAGHHVMVDQPVALAATLGALASNWWSDQQGEME